VNPAHLFLGTANDNNVDRKLKGRSNAARGDASGPAKLTSADVVAIRTRHAAGGMTQSALARAYGVDPAAISYIVRRINWKHLA